MWRENIFKPTTGNSLHRDTNDNGVRIVNFATSKSLIVKSTGFPHHNIHKYTLTSPDGKTNSHIDHVLIDRRQHSSILFVRSFRGADCDTDHYLVVAKIMESLAVSNQAALKFYEERFILGKLNELQVRIHYQIEISNGFAALKKLRDSEDINRGWENIKEDTKTSAKESLGLYELKQHKLWFDEEYLGF